MGCVAVCSDGSTELGCGWRCISTTCSSELDTAASAFTKLRATVACVARAGSAGSATMSSDGTTSDGGTRPADVTSVIIALNNGTGGRSGGRRASRRPARHNVARVSLLRALVFFVNFSTASTTDTNAVIGRSMGPSMPSTPTDEMSTPMDCAKVENVP